ncbi:MAG: hypothetical protein FWF95_01860 [Syntrophorhabdaceae bacterium]|nr:hypothetical protein [Syntrophorhabdaceae bacterium]
MKEKKTLKNVGQFVSWLIVKGIIVLVSFLPLCILFPAFHGLAAAFRVFGVRRRTVRTNLRAALGKELTKQELARIERDCYAEYGRILAEIFASSRLLRKKEDRFELTGRQIVDEAMQNGKGLLTLTGHIGNFVAVAHYLPSLGINLTFIAKRIANEYLNRDIEATYGRNGNKVISVKSARNDPEGGAKLFRALKQGNIVIALVDQDAGPRGTQTTFFGLPTYLPGGPVALACRGGIPVTTGFVTREDGRIRIEVNSPIDYSQATSTEEAVSIILDEYSRQLEQKVRKCPEQYFWFHKKWKALPEIRAQY